MDIYVRLGPRPTFYAVRLRRERDHNLAYLLLAMLSCWAVGYAEHWLLVVINLLCVALSGSVFLMGSPRGYDIELL